MEQLVLPNNGQPGVFLINYLEGFLVDMGQILYPVCVKPCNGTLTIFIKENCVIEFLIYLVHSGNLFCYRCKGSPQQLYFKQSPVICSLFDVTYPGQKKFGGCPMYMGYSWFDSLSNEFDKEYFKKLSGDIESEREHSVVYPAPENVFAWTWACSVFEVKVVILGQDPYQNGQAHGLAFSVLPGTPIPPSLGNIYKELEFEGFFLQGQRPAHGYLMGWARQGVLLLNTWLTVEAGESESHRNLGWNVFTDAVIASLNENHDGIVFMLWGREAQKKGKDINKSKHTVLTARHPSRMGQSDGNTFLKNGNFIECNNALVFKYGKQAIDWTYLPLD